MHNLYGIHIHVVVNAPTVLISTLSFATKCILVVIINEIETEKQILVLKINNNHVKCCRHMKKFAINGDYCA